MITGNLRHAVGVTLLSFVVFFMFFCPPRRFVDNHAGKRLIALLHAEGNHQELIWERVYLGQHHHLQNYVQYQLRRWLKSRGVWDVSLVNSLLCALLLSLFAGLIWFWLGRYSLTSLEKLGLWLFVLFGAPGIVLLYRHTEDNLTYYPFVFAFFLLLSRWKPVPEAWDSFAPQKSWLTWLLAGALWGLAWHWNTTTIVFAGLAVLLPWQWYRKKRLDSLPVVVALLSATAVYALIQTTLFADYPSEVSVLSSLELLFGLDQGTSDLYPNNLSRFSWAYVQKTWLGVQSLLLFSPFKHGPLHWLTSLTSLVLWCGTLAWGCERLLQGDEKLARHAGLCAHRLLLLLGTALLLAVLFESNALERWDMAFFCFAILWIVGYLSETRKNVKRFLWIFVCFQLCQSACLYKDPPYRQFYSYAIRIKNFNDRNYRTLVDKIYREARAHNHPHRVRALIMPYRYFPADLSLRLAWQGAWDDVYFARRDTVKGRQVWRFYTCPNPRDPCSADQLPDKLNLKQLLFVPNKRMLSKADLWGTFETSGKARNHRFHIRPIPMHVLKRYLSKFSKDAILVHKELRHLFLRKHKQKRTASPQTRPRKPVLSPAAKSTPTPSRPSPRRPSPQPVRLRPPATSAPATKPTSAPATKPTSAPATKPTR